MFGIFKPRNHVLIVIAIVMIISTSPPSSSLDYLPDNTIFGERDHFSSSYEIGSPIFHSSSIGGSDRDKLVDISVGEDGLYYALGMTWSDDFPGMESGGYQNNGASDCIIIKLFKNGTQSSVVSMVGGNDTDVPIALDIDSDGNIFITGYSFSHDFPIVNATETTVYGQKADCFLTVISSNGTILYSTVFGGISSDSPNDIIILPNSTVVVSGTTSSHDFPTIPSVANSHQGSSDIFITVIDWQNDSIEHSSLVGGSGTDQCRDSLIEPDGGLLICGVSSSSDLPLQSLSIGPRGSFDSIIMDFNLDFDLQSTLTIGGQGDDIPSKAVLTDTELIIGGSTTSQDFPITLDGIFQELNGTSDGFLTRLSLENYSVIYSSYFGAEGEDSIVSLSVDSANEIYLIGNTDSTSFPTSGYLNSSHSGQEDIFASKISVTGTILFSNLIGGSNIEIPNCLVQDNNGTVTIGGITTSNDFPSVNGQNSIEGYSDGFIYILGDCGDSDGDALPDFMENFLGTDRYLIDSDNDNLTDYDEVHLYDTDPTNPDTDSDQLPDDWEIQYGFNPNLSDSYLDPDEDGLSNLLEYNIGTNPLDSDSDRDGFPDGWEYEQGWNPLDSNVPFLEYINYYSLWIIGGSLVIIGTVSILYLRDKYILRSLDIQEDDNKDDISHIMKALVEKSD